MYLAIFEAESFLGDPQPQIEATLLSVSLQLLKAEERYMRTAQKETQP